MSSVSRRKIDISKILFLLIFVGVVIFFTAMNKNYLSAANINNIFRQVAIIAICALGLTFVIVIGRTDISFYLNACCSAMFCCWLVSLELPAIVCILAGVGIGCLFGLVSGFLAGAINLPDIIITIAIGCISYGLTYTFNDGKLIFVSETEMAFINNGYVGRLAMPTLLMIILYFVSFVLLEKTRFGVHFYSTGINKKAASYSGVKVAAVSIAAFVICSAMASLAGMINAASKGSCTVDIAITFLMPSFTAVYIGIAIFKRPCVIGTFLGALLVQLLSNGFTMMNLQYYFGDLITACLLISALFISIIRTKDNLKKITSNEPSLVSTNDKEGK